MANPEIKLVRINETNLNELQNLSRQTFFDTYGWGNTAENMQIYLNRCFSKEKLEYELKNPNSEFFFAKLDGVVVGYLKLNYGNAQTEFQEENGMEVERIYVVKEYQGKKIGRLLIQKAIDLGIERQMEYLWLGVWERNPKAISFYEKSGFSHIGEHTFMLGTDKQTDFVFKKNLQVVASNPPK